MCNRISTNMKGINMNRSDILTEAKEITNKIAEWRRIAFLLQEAKTVNQIEIAINSLKATIEKNSRFFEVSDIELHLNYYVTMGYISKENAQKLKLA